MRKSLKGKPTGGTQDLRGLSRNLLVVFSHQRPCAKLHLKSDPQSRAARPWSDSRRRTASANRRRISGGEVRIFAVSLNGANDIYAASESNPYYDATGLSCSSNGTDCADRS